MADDDLQRVIGRVEGRLEAAEKAMAILVTAQAEARREHNEDLGRIYTKLDELAAKMNQGVGMAMLGKLVWAAAAAVVGAVASHFWPSK